MSNIFNDYSNKISPTGREGVMKCSNDFFLDTFKDAPEYEQVKLGQDDSYDSNLYDAWVYDGDSYKKLVNEDTIIFPPTMSKYIDKVFSGQYIRPQRQGGTFMIVSKSNAYENKIKAKIAHCTQTLKFRDKFNNVIERPVVLKDEFTGDDIGYDQTINIPKGNMVLYCPIDEKTSIIDINDRFLFNGVPFKTNSVAKFVNDNNTGNPTIMKVSVFRDQRADGDDVINNLPVTDITYIIESDITSINQTIGYTTQLNVVVKRNGDVYSTPITFESSNDFIATVSNTGVVNLLSNGSCNITVKMTENVNIQVVIPIEVSVVENTTIIFDPLVDKIYQGESQQYTVKKYIGDTLQPDILSITASGLSVLYYDLTIIGNTFIVKNKKYSRTPLTITASDGVNSNSFNIILRGGF